MIALGQASAPGWLCEFGLRFPTCLMGDTPPVWLWQGFIGGPQQQHPLERRLWVHGWGQEQGHSTGVVWAPPHLLCVWELDVLHSNLINQGRDESNRDRDVVRATVQPERSGQCSLYTRPEGEPSMGTTIGLHPMRLPATSCSGESTGLRELSAFPW